MTKQEAYKKIDEFAKLDYDGWDGYGAFAIEKESLDILKDIIDNVSDNALDDWIIFPGKYGGISFERKNKELSVIQYTDNKVTFVIADEVDNKPFMVDCGTKEYALKFFIEILNRINDYYEGNK